MSSEKALYEIFLKAKQVIESDRKIPDEIKVFVHTLKMTGYTDEEIAALLPISPRAIRTILHDPHFQSAKVQSLYDRAEETLKRRLDTQVNTILASIDELDLNKASLIQKTTAIAQLIDKSRLLAGKSTNNVAMAYEVINKVNGSPLDEEIKELEESLLAYSTSIPSTPTPKDEEVDIFG